MTRIHQRTLAMVTDTIMCMALLLIPLQCLAGSGSKATDSIPFFASFLEKEKIVFAAERASSDGPVASLADRASRIARVAINIDAIDAAKIASGDMLSVGLFDNTSLEATIDKVTISNKITTIRGKISGSDNGYIIITVHEKKILTVIELPAEGYQYKIVYDNDLKTHVLYKTPLSALDNLEGAPSLIPPSRSNESRSLYGVNEEIILADDTTPATIDVMVVYTPAAASWAVANGTSINNVIAQAVAKAQLALANSNTLINMQLVHSAQVAYTESGNYSTDLNRLTNTTDGYMDTVHTLRDQYGADLVALFSYEHQTGGVGWLLQNKSGRPMYAFNLVRVQQAGWTYTHIHEMGHNMGAHHHKDQDVQPGPTSWYDWAENTWSAGWRWVGNDLNGYCSLMTYSDQDHSNTAYFSNSDPNIDHQGQAVGDSADGDNARTLREMRTVISAYRTPPELECTIDADCSGGDICSNNKCVECVVDDDCEEDKYCDEGNDICVDCMVDSDCDDGGFCNGEETCEAGLCVSGTSPCEEGETCEEVNDICMECLIDADCDDAIACNGEESCVNGICTAGTPNCNVGTYCHEESDTCVECQIINTLPGCEDPWATMEQSRTYTSTAEVLLQTIAAPGEPPEPVPTKQEILDTCAGGCCYAEISIVNFRACVEGTICYGYDRDPVGTYPNCSTWDVVCGSADNPPTIDAGPYLAAATWPELPTSSNSPIYLNQNEYVLWTFSDDYAAGCEDCTHVAEYQAVGAAGWTGVEEITSDKALGYAYVELPVTSLSNATTYAFRFSVTDCASQTTNSDEHYFRVSLYDNPPIIDAGPFLATGAWPALSRTESRAFVLNQDEYVLWSFNDDYASCSDMTWHRARYRKIVDDGTWIWEWLDVSTDSTEKEFAYTSIPASSMDAGTYMFVAEIIDCDGQLTRSTTSYFKVE